MRAAAVMLVVVIAAAIAGGADRASAAPAPAYRAAADRVCAVANARLAAIPVPRTSGEVRPWVGRALPLMAASTRRIRGLAPPPALRARHRAWVRALALRVATARALRDGIDAGASPSAALQAALPRLEAQKRAARARARALGLRACSGRAPA